MNFTSLIVLVLAGLSLTSPARIDANEWSPQAMSRVVDERIEAILAEQQIGGNVEPCDDPTYVRRISLDLTGRIPTPEEIHRFQLQPASDRRQQFARSLAQSAACRNRMAYLFRNHWFPQTNLDPYRYLAPDIERWIAQQLAEGRCFNELAADLIRVSMSPEVPDTDSAASPRWLDTPKALIEVNDHSPAQMAAHTTSAFLGVDLGCAQCHDHPFDRWTQDQFWSTAAFFVPTRTAADSMLRLDELSITVAESDRRVSASLFDGSSVEWQEERAPESGREALAFWLARNDNPYFSKHTINLVWEDLFGSPLAPLSHSGLVSEGERMALLDELDRGFRANHFQLTWLLESLTLTQHYQAATQTPAQRGLEFARPSIRGLDARQLFRSLHVATGTDLIGDDLATAQQLRTRRDFEELFQSPDNENSQRSVSQALALMNSPAIQRLCDPDNNRLVAGISNAPFLSSAQRVEALFLSTLGRTPTEQESQLLQVKFFGPDEGQNAADGCIQIFWVLINTIEFSTNH